MDSSTYLSLTTTILGLFLLLFFSYYLLSKPKSGNTIKKAPEAAGARPIIGHLHLFGGQGLPHKTLGAMADQYGPAFAIKLGIHKTLVVSNSEVAKECFTANDKALASRPSSIALKIMGYNNSLFAFAPYGPYWREVRKIVMVELLSQRRLELLKNVWMSEIDAWIAELYDLCVRNDKSSIIDMKKWFQELGVNIVVRLIAGQRGFGKVKGGDDKEGEIHNRRLKALRRYFKLSDAFLIEDALPFLSWLDVHGKQREMKSIARELDSLLQGWLKDHKDRRSTGGEGRGDEDFMDVMLSILKDSNIADKDADTVNKATCLNLILGASDTTVVTLTWALSLLLNNKNTLKKAQDELKAHFDPIGHVDESEIKNLVYLQAIIKETLRLYPAAPLSATRECLEDIEVAGYSAPAGTRIIMNLWKIQRDPSIWADPSEFRPERFLITHKDVDLWGQHYELTPFGSGRRSCPGAGFALKVVPFTLACLLYRFELTTPGGALVDMTESAGLTNMKTTPLEVITTPRKAAAY